MTTYFGIVRKDAGTAYGVDFPDFPGCVAAGDTAEEAMRLGEGALGLHIRGMLEDGEPIPPPSPRGAVLACAENQDGALSVFPVVVPGRP